MNARTIADTVEGLPADGAVAARLEPATADRTSPGGFRPDIQGLRAIAVLLVALNHAGVPFLGGGYVGVDVFFVVSGFLITGWLVRRAERTGKVPFAAFYAARARRILPAATLTIVAICLASWYALNYVRALDALHDAVWAALFAANIHFANIGADYFARDNPPSPFQHFWTLAVEEQFYVVWPALLAVLLLVLGGVRRSGPHVLGRAVQRRLVIAVALLVAASLAWSVHITPIDPNRAYFSTLARGWELGVGALLALCAGRLLELPGWARAQLSWLGLAGIMLAAVAYSSHTAFPGYAALLPVVASGMVIVGGLGRGTAGGAGLLLSRQPLRVVGDASYSFYLWHWPVLIITAEYAGRTLSVGENLLLLAAALGISLATYRWFENPLRHAAVLMRPRYALALWPVTVALVILVSSRGIDSLNQQVDPPVALKPIVAKRLPTYEQAVVDAATPARLSQPIPSGLDPSPLQLDRGRPTGCVTWGGLGRRCTLGDVNAHRRIVVFGDSHAGAWMPALSYYARTRGLALVPVVHASCTTGVTAFQGDCLTWFHDALQRVRQLRPKAVIVAQYFDPRESAASTFSGLQREVAAFSRLVPHVVVLQDPPRHDVVPIDCLLGNGATLGSCAFAVDQAEAGEYARVPGIVRSSGGDYLPTLRWFCAHGTCPMVVGKTIVYVDTNHITTSYARVLAVPVSAALSVLIGTPRK
ncbi:MAG: acyltransferase family protein [Gaiellales bacterium]